MKKPLALTAFSLAGILAFAGAHAADTDVTFGGKYNGNTLDVHTATATTTYTYTKSDGSTSAATAYNVDPAKTDFTYTDAGGTTADLSAGDKTQSDFTGPSAASGDIVSDQDIVAGATADRSNYTYKNGKGDTVTLGTEKQSFTESVTLDATYAGGASVDVTDGTSAAFGTSMYKYVDPTNGRTYTLDSTASKFVDAETNMEQVPSAGTEQATALANMIAAYNTDKANIETAKTNTSGYAAQETTLFNAADTVFTTDEAMIATLDSRWQTYQTATGAYAAAQQEQATAKATYDANDAARTAALAVFDAPILDTIDGRANDAIAASVANGGAINTALTAGDEATLTSAKTYADTQDAATLESAKTYTDEKDTAVRADFAAADEATLNSAKEYAAAQDALTLTDAKAYADERAAFSLAAANAYTDQRIDKLDKDLSAGIASSVALSSVAVSGVERGEVSVGAGFGHYNSQSAVAFGAAMGLTNNWSVNVGAGISDADVAFRAGTNYKFKLF